MVKNHKCGTGAVRKHTPKCKAEISLKDEQKRYRTMRWAGIQVREGQGQGHGDTSKTRTLDELFRDQ